MWANHWGVCAPILILRAGKQPWIAELYERGITSANSQPGHRAAPTRRQKGERKL